VTNGQATFAGCAINKVGTSYTLVATSSPVYTSATSTAFNVTLGAAVKLAFTSEPGASTSNTQFTVQPVIAIQDAGGNTVTTAPATTVTLTIGTNPSAGTLTCSSGNSRTTVSGVATFSGCYINNAGVGYTLVASTTGYTSATSTAFTVSAPAAVISMSAFPTIINRGQASTLTVQFASFGASRQVTFQKKTALDFDWITVSTVTMDSTGRATIPIAPTSTTSYRVVWAGATDLSAATSPAATVGVRLSVTLQPRSVTGTRTLARGTSVTYRATVRPLYAGQRVSFLIYQKVAGHWTFRTSATATVDASGVATFAWKWSKSGQWYMRARANSTPLNITAYSNIEKVIIR
jgi:trimeric autotransporter adhesin